MKKQIILIHGGEVFNTYEDYIKNLRLEEIELKDLFRKGWKKTLALKLGADWEVIAPRMPCGENAKYLEWKIYFEKIVPFTRDGVILIGHSLGGIFLAKYLSENKFPKKIKAVLLIATPHTEKFEHSLADFILPNSLLKLEKQGGSIFLYYSSDDMVVPIQNMKSYERDLPTAKMCLFSNYGHFSVEKFPEIIKDIKKLK